MAVLVTWALSTTASADEQSRTSALQVSAIVQAHCEVSSTPMAVEHDDDAAQGDHEVYRAVSTHCPDGDASSFGIRPQSSPRESGAQLDVETLAQEASDEPVTLVTLMF